MYIGIDKEGLPELIFGTRLADRNPTAQGFQGRYRWYQTNAASPGGGSVRSSDFAWTLGNALQGVEGRGLNRGSGWGQFIDAPTGRLMDLAVVLGGFTIHPDSTVDLVSAVRESASFPPMARPFLGRISPPRLPGTTHLVSRSSRRHFRLDRDKPYFSIPMARCKWQRQAPIHFLLLRERW